MGNIHKFNQPYALRHNEYVILLFEYDAVELHTKSLIIIK